MSAIAAIATAAGLLVPIADGPAPITIDNAGRSMSPPPPAIASMNPARRAAPNKKISVTVTICPGCNCEVGRCQKLQSAPPEAKIRDAHQAPRVLFLPAAIPAATASQRLHRMWQAAAGEIRSAADREVHDEADAVRARLDDVAVSGGAAGKAGREHDLAGRRVDPSHPCPRARLVTENGAAVREGRVAQSDSELQGARDGDGRFDGKRARRQKDRCTLGRERRR